MNMEMTWPEDRARSGRWENVGGIERWASAAIGVGLLLGGLAKRDRGGALAAVAGGALLFRGASGHCPVNSALGRDTAHDHTREVLVGDRGIHVKESITINRPSDELYRFWRNFENLPRFMEHLKSVQTTGPDRSHWVAKGPAGTHVSWDAEIINEIENQVIGWRSLPGSTITSAGSVNFDDAGGDRGTRITVHLQYEPPAGKVGALFATLFGEEPSQQVHADLRRLKQLLEAGEVPTTKGQPNGRERERHRTTRRSA